MIKVNNREEESRLMKVLSENGYFWKGSRNVYESDICGKYPYFLDENAEYKDLSPIHEFKGDYKSVDEFINIYNEANKMMDSLGFPKLEEMVNHPSHYQGEGGMEAIDAMIGIFGKEETKIFCKINAFKYICRLGKKDDEIQEAEKAKWYINKFVELSK